MIPFSKYTSCDNVRLLLKLASFGKHTHSGKHIAVNEPANPINISGPINAIVIQNAGCARSGLFPNWDSNMELPHIATHDPMAANIPNKPPSATIKYTPALKSRCLMFMSVTI